MSKDNKARSWELSQALDDLHGSIKSIEAQTTEIKALSLNQMQVLTRLFDNESDVPRMFLTCKKEYSKTFCGAFKKVANSVSTMGGAVCEVSIGCECCLRTGKKAFSTSVAL